MGRHCVLLGVSRENHLSRAGVKAGQSSLFVEQIDHFECVVIQKLILGAGSHKIYGSIYWQGFTKRFNILGQRIKTM